MNELSKSVDEMPKFKNPFAKSAIFQQPIDLRKSRNSTRQLKTDLSAYSVRQKYMNLTQEPEKFD